MSGDGSAWVDCRCGARHWGVFGAAGLLLRTPDERVLMQLRAGWSHHGGSWSLPGGARDSHERPVDAALREAFEETGIDPRAVVVDGVVRAEHGTWRYDTVFGYVPEELPVTTTDESDALEWVLISEVQELPLHPALGAAWGSLIVSSTHALVDLRGLADPSVSLGALEDRLASGWRTVESPVVRVTALLDPDAHESGPSLTSLVEQQSWRGDSADLQAHVSGRHQTLLFTNDADLAVQCTGAGLPTESLSEAIGTPR